jgi:hypothetical protein
MTTEYKHMNWVFDADAFAEMLRDRVSDTDMPAFAELLGVSVSIVRGWIARYSRGTEFDHPHMSNFLKVCNLLDVDPRLFFGVE